MAVSEGGTFRFGLTREDWSLNRKGEIDKARHAEKVKEAIRDQLPNVVTDAAIVGSPDGQTIVKVPIRSLELPRFRYDFGRNKHIGQGDGTGNTDGTGNSGSGAGTAPGIDVLEQHIYIRPVVKLV